jgi:protein TonB
MAGKTDIFNKDWVEIVFEDRNKEYGAYQLRKEKEKNIAIGIIAAIVIFTLTVSAPLIIKLIEGVLPNQEKLVSTEVTMAEPPPIDKTLPPPPVVPPPPPLKSTVQFVPPVIVPDKDVPDEPPPTQEQLKDVDAGKETVKGDPNAVDPGLSDAPVVDDAPAQVYVSVEQMPEFLGGEAELFKYLGQKINYPPIAKENGISGKVYVEFVVDPDGAIKDVKVLRGIGGGCDEEALRVIKAMPKWKAGKQNGRTVNVSFKLPINFKLN